MGRADVYLNTLVKFGALRVILKSNSTVALELPTGVRHGNQSTTHEVLQALIQEIAPPSVASELHRGSNQSFEYNHLGKPYTIDVNPRGGVWTISMGPAAAAAAPAPAVDSAGPPGLDAGISIERHNYSDAAAAPPKTHRTGKSKKATAGSMPKAVAANASAVLSAPPMAPSSISASAPMGTGAGGSPTRVEQLLLDMIKSKASDLHLSTGSPPMIRHDGEMKPLGDHPPFTPESMLEQLYEITPEKNRLEFEQRHDTDFAHAMPGVSRFRANLFRDRKGPGAVFRAIPFKILPPEALGISKGVLDLCYLTKGLVLVTGPTGSGKSTTLATLIDYVNRNRNDHIITIEDPIEFVHENKKCLINQREVHTHTKGFKDALRAALREDPDIVLVGEMRDLETIAIAVETAETGHLVFGTLHTTTAPSTVDRIIDQFPADRQEQIRQMLAESLRGVVAQTLCKKIGGGRVAAYEVLLGSNAVSNLIRESKTFQLFSLMQTGRAAGMITMNDSLIDLVKKGLVDPQEAYMKAVNKGEFKGMLERAGHKVVTSDKEA